MLSNQFLPPDKQSALEAMYNRQNRSIDQLTLLA